MSLTVYSPYDGQPVQIRPQDVGRAIRDGQGLVFYVLPTSDGKGHYASKTRQGSTKEQAAYQERLSTLASESSKAVATHPIQPLDATGRRRGPSRLAVVLAVGLALAVAAITLVMILR